MGVLRGSDYPDALGSILSLWSGERGLALAPSFRTLVRQARCISSKMRATTIKLAPYPDGRKQHWQNQRSAYGRLFTNNEQASDLHSSRNIRDPGNPAPDIHMNGEA